MKRKEILEAAEKCVCVEREGQYGKPENSFQRIANLWNAYLGDMAVPIKPRDVAAMMALLKIARISRGLKDDNWIDLAGYAACGGEIDDSQQGTAS